MPQVNTPHPIYTKLKKRWTMIRDAVEGESAVKAAGEAYLPKLLEQEEKAYKAYKMRALFFEAARRTLQGLVGMVMRKDPNIEASPSTIEGFLKHVTNKNLAIEGFTNVVMQEVLMMNKYGILADLPPVITIGVEPWLVGYTAESIINWEYGTDEDGKNILTRVVLEEDYKVTDGTDRFVAESKKQWRVLELVPKDQAFADIQKKNPKDRPDIVFDSTKPNVYRVQLWRKKEDEKPSAASAAVASEFTMHDELFPTLRGAAMDSIPFIIVTGGDSDAQEQKPPLEGLASVNMSHYRTSADLEHGRHFVALPTPYIVGLSADQKLSIGSAYAWVITGVDAQQVKVGMLEFTGQGLEALEKAMIEKQSQMAVLGARLLEEQKKAAEAFETHELRSAGEHSVLANVAIGVGDGLTEVMAIMTAWDSSLGTITITLNTEFVKVSMAPTFLKEIIAALQTNRLSFHAFFYNMQQRGMYPEGHSEEDERKLIEADAAEFGLNVVNEIDDLDDEDDDKDNDNEEDE